MCPFNIKIAGVAVAFHHLADVIYIGGCVFALEVYAHVQEVSGLNLMAGRVIVVVTFNKAINQINGLIWYRING